MKSATLNKAAAFVRRLSECNYGGISDRQLLEHYVAGGQEQAFAALVRRHAALVFGVCKRVLRNDADAQDAFQATFLVLARKAGTASWQNSISSWLYSVAYRVSLKSRSQRVRRQQFERAFSQQRPTNAPVTPVQSEPGILDDELQRLPDKYRLPLLLCCLEGLTQDQAARRLGWSPDSVRGRLYRGRQVLATRLKRRGITVSAALSATLLWRDSACAALTPDLLRQTVQLAKAFAATVDGSAMFSPTVHSLANGVLHTMFLSKIRTALAAMSMVIVIITGILLGMGMAPAAFLPAASANAAEEDDEPRVNPEERALLRRTIFGALRVVTANEVTVELDDLDVNIAFSVAADAKIVAARTPATLADLKPGQEVVLRLAADNKTISHLRAFGKRVEGTLTAIDPAASTVTIRGDDDDDDQPAPLTHVLDNKVRVLLGGQSVALADLARDMPVEVELSSDQKRIVEIKANWPENNQYRRAELVHVDPVKGTLTIEGDEDNEQEVHLNLLKKDVRVLLNGSVAELTALRRGAEVVLRLTADGDVAAIWATTPQGRKAPFVD